jgi:hypothetical protein
MIAIIFGWELAISEMGHSDLEIYFCEEMFNSNDNFENFYSHLQFIETW